MAIADRAPLYVDSSSMLLWVLGQPGYEGVQAVVERWSRAGDMVVSSRLLALEVSRILTRERLSGNRVSSANLEVLDLLTLLPLTEAVWENAAAIEQHVRSLDAIHLATCELAGATLLTAGLDGSIATVALARGIPTV